MLSQKAVESEAVRLGIPKPGNKLCLVIGSAPSALLHYEEFQSKFSDVPYDVMSINKSIFLIERADHFATRHPCILPGCKAERRRRGWHLNFKTHCADQNYLVDEQRFKLPKNYGKKDFDYVWKVYYSSGSSSLLGIGCCIGIGYSGVVLCGVELTAHCIIYQPYFINFANGHQDYARSMGQHYRRIDRAFAKPDANWIGETLK